MARLIEIIQMAFAIVVTFGLAVAVHEFGHMFFALVRGVGVESFALGMGPKITSWKWKGIDFSLRWLPIGGFVKLMPPAKKPTGPAAESFEAVGEAAIAAQSTAEGAIPASEDKTIAESSYDDLYALADKDTLTKLLVFGGGVFMNFITAIFAIALLSYIGTYMPLQPFEVEAVAPGSELAKYDVHPGDKLTSVDGLPVRYFSKFSDAIYNKFEGLPEDAKAIEGREPDGGTAINFKLTFDRAGKSVTVPFENVTPARFLEIFSLENLTLLMDPVIDDVLPNQPAQKAGLRQGDRIVEINDKKITTWNQMATEIRANPGTPVKVKYTRNGTEQTATLTPTENVPIEGNVKDAASKKKEGMIGILPAAPEKELVREGNALRALANAPGIAYRMTKRMAELQVTFFRRASLKQVGQNVGGPIAIAMVTAHNASRGFRDSLDWFIKLNLLLLMFNLLPIPVLDGGFILLSLIEGVIRRPVPPRVLGPIYTGFVILFICLIVVISLLDIRNTFM